MPTELLDGFLCPQCGEHFINQDIMIKHILKSHSKISGLTLFVRIEAFSENHSSCVNFLVILRRAMFFLPQQVCWHTSSHEKVAIFHLSFQWNSPTWANFSRSHFDVINSSSFKCKKCIPELSFSSYGELMTHLKCVQLSIGYWKQSYSLLFSFPEHLIEEYQMRKLKWLDLKIQVTFIWRKDVKCRSLYFIFGTKRCCHNTKTWSEERNF